MHNLGQQALDLLLLERNLGYRHAPHLVDDAALARALHRDDERVVIGLELVDLGQLLVDEPLEVVNSRDALGGELGRLDLVGAYVDAETKLNQLSAECAELGLGVGHKLALPFVVVDGVLLVVCGVAAGDGG